MIGNGTLQIVDNAVDIKVPIVGFKFFMLDGSVKNGDAKSYDGEKANGEQDTVARFFPKQSKRVRTISV